MAQVTSKRLWRRCVSKLRSDATPKRQPSTAASVPGSCPFFKEKSPDLQTAFKNEIYHGAKPYDEVPSPRSLPLVGTTVDLIKFGGATKIHEYAHHRHMELGPIFKEVLGNVEAVFISDKDDINKVYKTEGDYPKHMVPEAWRIYNEKHGIERGLFFMDGPQWHKRRKILNQFLLAPNAFTPYTTAYHEVLTHLFDRWDSLSSKERNNVVPDLENELYHWSVESLGLMIFGRRMGFLTRGNERESRHEFVQNVQQIFTESVKLAVIPPKIAYRFKLPVWKRFEQSATKALGLARRYVDQYMVEIENKSDEKYHGLLTKLMDQPDMSKDEIINIIADLILAAADTTSHAVQWALYALSKLPDYQEKIHSQLTSVTPAVKYLTADEIPQTYYITYLIKESLRLYPIASFLTRILPQEIVLGGYKVPAGKLILMSQYTTSRSELVFKDATKFDPERWADDSLLGRSSNHGSLPFGRGSRSCIGRRIAEIQMHLFVARIVQQFQLRCANEKEVGLSLRMITTPSEPIRLNLKRRDS